MVNPATRQVWAVDDAKFLWTLHPLSLKVQSKVNLTSLFNFKEKSQLELYQWVMGKVIIFDRVSGIGGIFHQHKILLKFREFIGKRTSQTDWTYTLSVSPNRYEISAIVAGYHENRFLRYDVARRRIRTRGIKEYDLAHSALIVEDKSFAQSAQKAHLSVNAYTPQYLTLVLESNLGSPVCKLYLESKFQTELYFKQILNPKFTKTFWFDVGVFVGIHENKIVIASVKSNSLRLLSTQSIKTADDEGTIQHVELMRSSFLIVGTNKAFYRITLPVIPAA